VGWNLASNALVGVSYGWHVAFCIPQLRILFLLFSSKHAIPEIHPETSSQNFIPSSPAFLTMERPFDSQPDLFFARLNAGSSTDALFDDIIPSSIEGLSESGVQGPMSRISSLASLQKRKRLSREALTSSNPDEKALDEAYGKLKELVRYSNRIEGLHEDRSKAGAVGSLSRDITKAVKARQAEALASFHTALSSFTKTKMDIPGCAICHSTYVEVGAVKPENCGHIVCDGCFEKLAKPECPRCRRALGEGTRVYV
jgi:hypothetical protein